MYLDLFKKAIVMQILLLCSFCIAFGIIGYQTATYDVESSVCVANYNKTNHYCYISNDQTSSILVYDTDCYPLKQSESNPIKLGLILCYLYTDTNSINDDLLITTNEFVAQIAESNSNLVLIVALTINLTLLILFQTSLYIVLLNRQKHNAKNIILAKLNA